MKKRRLLPLLCLPMLLLWSCGATGSPSGPGAESSVISTTTGDDTAARPTPPMWRRRGRTTPAPTTTMKNTFSRRVYQITARQSRIENLNVDYDYVNPLLNDVGESTFYKGHD